MRHDLDSLYFPKPWPGFARHETRIMITPKSYKSRFRLPASAPHRRLFRVGVLGGAVGGERRLAAHDQQLDGVGQVFVGNVMVAARHVEQVCFAEDVGVRAACRRLKLVGRTLINWPSGS